MPIPEVVRRVVRDIRDEPLVNRVSTATLKAIFRDHPPEVVVAHLPRHGEVQVTTSNGGTFKLWSLGDDWITSRLWWRGLRGFEPEMNAIFDRIVVDARVVFDVGAYTGFYALLAAAARSRPAVFAFEPHPLTRERLARNIALNPGLDVEIVPLAVADEPGTAQLHLGDDGLASASSLSPASTGAYGSIAVEVTTLDTFARTRGLVGRIDVVKIDVERVEPAVIAGMTGVLESDRPAVFLEVNPGNDEGYADASARLAAAGYRFFHLRPDGAHPEDALRPPDTYIDHAHTPINHLACHRDRTPSWLDR